MRDHHTYPSNYQLLPSRSHEYLVLLLELSVRKRTGGYTSFHGNLTRARLLPIRFFTAPDRGDCLDYARVPDLGYGDVLDAVRHLLCFALDLMTPGKIDEKADAEYIHALEWYHTLPDVLAGGAEGDDQRHVRKTQA